VDSASKVSQAQSALGSNLTTLPPKPDTTLRSKVAIFAVTHLLDVALATAAATAAAAAGAHAAGAPLTSEILRHAAVGGALKAGAMAFAGLVMLAPQNTPFVVLPMLLGTSIGTNVLLVAAISNWTLGYGESQATPHSLIYWSAIKTGRKYLLIPPYPAPTQLLAAAVVASIPLAFCPVYYYGGRPLAHRHR
jgi:hypothetical protein